jgi:hypothetical protein
MSLSPLSVFILLIFYVDNLTLRILWLIICVIATTYLYCWDIKMDWGLLQPQSQHKFIRDTLMYPWTWVRLSEPI